MRVESVTELDETANPLMGFDDFFRTEFPRLSRLLGAADASAADALQDAFFKASQAWSKVSVYDDPAAWVRRVAVHRMLDERRSNRRRAAAMVRLRVPESFTPPDPDGRIDIDRMIAGLPLQQRVALSLFYLGGFTSSEVGESMGITDGAVRFHLNRARSALRSALGDQHD